MKFSIPVQELWFEVDQVPVEAVIGTNGSTRRTLIPHKKALVHRQTGQVLGVVSRDYRVVTNQEAVDLAHEVCRQAFPGVSPVEWEVDRAAAPRTLGHAFIDLRHKTHVLNFYDIGGSGADDPYTPFLRVTNSFNGARALRFDIGFMRKHCSNGVIFEEEVATIKAAHNREALAKLQIEISAHSLPEMWKEFTRFVTAVRGIAVTPDQATLALNAVLRPPVAKPDDKPQRRHDLQLLRNELSHLLEDYRSKLGDNAYAVFNTLTDLAARPPNNPLFQKDRDTLEKRSGRWLKDLARQSQASTGFDLDRWITDWDPDRSRAMQRTVVPLS